MIESKLEIRNRLGLHARAAAKLVHAAGAFSSEVILIRDGEEVNAKSILSLLQLGAAQGTQIALRCEGGDEAEALATVTRLFEDRFGEDG